MTKEQFLKKWKVGDKMPPDLEAVIATEIAKVKEPQPELNPIAEAYYAYKPIRGVFCGSIIKKHSDTESIDEKGNIYKNKNLVFDFDINPQDWELYTEPEQVAETTKQTAKPFDRDRFEAMFRAVVASGRTESYEQDFLATNICLEKLDAYYATKEGGANG